MARSSDAGPVDLSEYRDIIDSATFDQILEMDDNEEKEFSKSIVLDFFQQAKTTFDEMDQALEKKDLMNLSSLGHFLKGSSATLGLIKVRDSCEKIQHFGAHSDESGANSEPDDAKCLSRCRTTIAQAKEEYAEVEKLLKRYYHQPA